MEEIHNLLIFTSNDSAGSPADNGSSSPLRSTTLSHAGSVWKEQPDQHIDVDSSFQRRHQAHVFALHHSSEPQTRWGPPLLRTTLHFGQRKTIHPSLHTSLYTVFKPENRSQKDSSLSRSLVRRLRAETMAASWRGTFKHSVSVLFSGCKQFWMGFSRASRSSSGPKFMTVLSMWIINGQDEHPI